MDKPTGSDKANSEVKYKENDLGGKQHVPLQDFILSDLDEITTIVNKQTLDQPLSFPTLLNSYDRSYWGTSVQENSNNHYDSNLLLYSLLHTPNFMEYTRKDRAIIMEIKYDKDQEKRLIG